MSLFLWNTVKNYQCCLLNNDFFVLDYVFVSAMKPHSIQTSMMFGFIYNVFVSVIKPHSVQPSMMFGFIYSVFVSTVKPHSMLPSRMLGFINKHQLLCLTQICIFICVKEDQRLLYSSQEFLILVCWRNGSFVLTCVNITWNLRQRVGQ